MPQNISVIIPTYNRAKLLSRSLNSVLQQTCPPSEIIVVDDGSTDYTEQLIKHDYPQVIYHHQPQLGVSAARNQGIQLASHSWLAFLDSDDEWLPDKLQKQQDMIGGNSNVKICHSDEIWVRNGIRVNPHLKHQKKGGWIFQHCLPLCAISPSAVLIHRSVFDIVGMFDESLPACEDYDLWLRMTCQYPVCYIDQPLIKKYGGHDDQLSRQYWGMDRFRIQSIVNILDHQQLSLQDRLAARRILHKKLSIYIQGALKRNKSEEAMKYQQIQRRFE